MTRADDLKSLLAGFRKCGPVYPDEWHAVIAAYAARRKYPRYYMSPSFLAHDGSYWWGRVENCLVILKRKWVMGRPVLYAVLPPMHYPDYGPSAEFLCGMRLLALGIGIKVSDEDIENIVPFVTPPIAQVGNFEYVYDLREVAAAQGPRFKRIRTARNKLDVRGNGLTMMTVPINDLGNIKTEICELTKQWTIRRGGRWKSAWKHTNAVLAGAEDISLIYEDGSLCAYSVIERICPNWYVGTMSFCSYAPDLRFKQASYALFWMDAAYAEGSGVFLGDDPGKPLYLNFGSAVGVQGLVAHKEGLGPCGTLQIYDLKPVHPVTAEEWKYAVPGGSVLQEALL